MFEIIMENVPTVDIFTLKIKLENNKNYSVNSETFILGFTKDSGFLP
jgi:hypothetical protein